MTAASSYHALSIFLLPRHILTSQLISIFHSVSISYSFSLPFLLHICLPPCEYTFLCSIVCFSLPPMHVPHPTPIFLSPSSLPPPPSAGDYSYAELDAIRARKVQQRAQRFRQPNPESTGYSSGGLMETRIGAVGGGGGGGGGGEGDNVALLGNNTGHASPEQLAQMY